MTDRARLAALIARADWPGAERLLRSAAARPGAPASVFYNLAKVLDMQGRQDARIPWLQKAVARDPAHADAWFELGRCLIPADLAGAEAAMTRSVALRPATDAWRTLARLRLRLCDWAGCAEALAHLPEDGETLTMAYRIACETGADSAALRDRLLRDARLRPQALKALTRVARGSLPLRLPQAR